MLSHILSIGCISEFWQHRKNRRNTQPLQDRDVWVENQNWRATDILHPLWMRGVICVVAQNWICLLLFQMFSDTLPGLSQTTEAGDHSNAPVLILLFRRSNSQQLVSDKKERERKKKTSAFKYTLEPARLVTTACLPGSLNGGFCRCSGPRPIKVHTSQSGAKLYRIVKWLVG